MRRKFSYKLILVFLLLSLVLYFSGGCGGGGGGSSGGGDVVDDGLDDGSDGGSGGGDGGSGGGGGDGGSGGGGGVGLVFYVEGEMGPVSKCFPIKNNVISIDPGTYRIVHDPTRINDNHNDPHFAIENRKNITIIAEDVEFIFTEVRDGLIFYNCSNVTLDGLTLRYSVPFHTQGVVTSVGSNSVEFKIDDGYPNLDELPGTGYMGVVWDKNLGRQKAGTDHLHNTELTKLNCFTGVNETGIVNGDTIVIRNLEIDPRTLISTGSENLTIQNVTVFDGGFAYMEDTGKGGHRYINCKVKVGAKPVGAAAERILSTAADAFHSNCMERGPIIENCEFENMGDDGVNIHGPYVEALEKNGNKIIVIAEPTIWTDPFLEGDTMKAYNKQSNKLEEAGAVMTPVKSLGIIKPTVVDPTAYCFKQANKKNKYKYFELTLTQADKVNSGNLLYSPNRIGAGFKIKNTRVRNNCARGFLIKSQNGTIENCEIDGSSMYGIQFDAELETYWAEAFIPRDVTATGNIIVNTGNRIGYNVPRGIYISQEAINNNILVIP